MINQILKIGQKIHSLSTNLNYEVVQFLGGGGQGEVYQVTTGTTSLALKWYFTHQATQQQKEALEIIIKKGSPSEKFLWPMDLVTTNEIPGFGYVMPLLTNNFKGIVALLKRRIEPSFRILTVVGMELAHSFLQLHSKGLCYRDISCGNVFFDPDTGAVRIGDNDNITINGSKTGGVLGTLGFMAPEIVQGKTLPNTQTDLFSLSVLFFYVFMLHHPLEGKKETEIKCFDLPAKTKLYGLEPIFIFDPNNDSNRPDPSYHQAVLNFWPIYPRFFQNLFIKAFTVGITDSDSRVRETEWRNELSQLRDAIFYCSNCKAENFYDLTQTYVDRKLSSCWYCKQETTTPPRISLRNKTVILNYDTQLFPHHINERLAFDFSEPVAVVTRHPTNPNIWGLKNLSNQNWIITKTDGTTKSVNQGNSFSLSIGTKVSFGTTEGEIKW